MKASVAILGVLLVAGSAFADPYVIAKQRARQTSDQNAAEQQQIQNAAGGPAQSAPATVTPGSPVPPPNPMLQATLKNIGDLQANFTALSSAATVKPDPAQKADLLNSLSQAAQAKKASSDSVKKLAADLISALSGNKLAIAPQKKLTAQVHALFNSGHLTDAQQKTMFDEIQKALTDAGVSLDDAVNVVTDLKKIAEETK